MYQTVVVFSVAPPLRRVSLRRYLAIVRRFPRVAIVAAVRCAISRFTRSPLTHVAAGNESFVVSASLYGVEFPRTVDYVVRRRYLAWMFVVPTPREAFPDEYDHARRMRPLRVIARWLTFGLIRSHDCVSSSCGMLRNAGVDVPRRITTPVGLYDWLRRSGYEQHDLGRHDGG